MLQVGRRSDDVIVVIRVHTSRMHDSDDISVSSIRNGYVLVLEVRLWCSFFIAQSKTTVGEYGVECGPQF